MKRGLCAFDDKRYLLPDGKHTLAHGNYAIRSEQTREFNESIPDSPLTQSFAPWLEDDENPDVAGFVTLSHTESSRIGVRPHITRDEVIAMVGGTDLRHEIDGLPSDNSMRDSNAPPRRARTIIDDGDTNVGDDANEFDELLNILDVAMSTGMNDPF
jgi:hypothetical protein